jgi:RimJ/RimL family protein N-acetyltransferase
VATGPEIRTDRLLITPFAERHLSPRYVGWLNDRELMRFSEQRHRSHTPESCRAYWRSFADSPHFFWAIEEVAAGLGHIGNINAYVDNHNLVADVGILVGEQDAQGQGLGHEAFAAVCRFLLDEAGMRKVTAGALANNAAMVRIMERLGMVDDGRRPRHRLWQGEEIDVIHRALYGKRES